MEAEGYGNFLGKLLGQKGLKNPTVARAGEEILEVVSLMLSEKDPRYVQDLANEFSPFLRWQVPFISDRMSDLIRKKGKQKRIEIISLETALEKAYQQPIHQVTRSSRELNKRFKNSQLVYLKESALTRYLLENTHAKLTVFLD